MEIALEFLWLVVYKVLGNLWGLGHLLTWAMVAVGTKYIALRCLNSLSL